MNTKETRALSRSRLFSHFRCGGLHLAQIPVFLARLCFPQFLLRIYGGWQLSDDAVKITRYVTTCGYYPPLKNFRSNQTA
jgi:hypothetical protein